MNVEKESISDKMNSNTEKFLMKKVMKMMVMTLMSLQIPKQLKPKLKLMKPQKLKLKPKPKLNLLNLMVMEKLNQMNQLPSTVVMLMKKTLTPILTLKMPPLKPQLKLHWKRRLKLMENHQLTRKMNLHPMMIKKKMETPVVKKKPDLAMPPS